MIAKPALLRLFSLAAVASLAATALAACAGVVAEDPDGKGESSSSASSSSAPPPTPNPVPGPGCDCDGTGTPPPIGDTPGCQCPIPLPAPVLDAGPASDAAIDVGVCSDGPGFECAYAGGGDCTVSVICVGGVWMCGPVVCAAEDAGPPGCSCPSNEPCLCGEDAGGPSSSSNLCPPGYITECGGDCICVPADGGTFTSGPSSSCGCPPDDQDCGCGSAGGSSGASGRQGGSASVGAG